MSGSERSLKPFDTDFNTQSGSNLHWMLGDADVDHVYDVAKNWLDVHDQLVGEEGDDGVSVRGRLVKAVKKVRETWHGKSAEKFSEEADKVIEGIGRGATFAKNVSGTMKEAADALQHAVGEMAKIDWGLPAWGSPYIEYERAIQQGIFDDPGLVLQSEIVGHDRYRRLGDAYKQVQEDLASGMSTEQILSMWKPDNDGDLARGDLWMPKFQRQALEAALAMEKLATSYKKHTSNLKPPEDIKGARPEGQRPSGGPKGGMPIPKGGLPGGGVSPSGLISGGAPSGAMGGPSGGAGELHEPGWSLPDVPGASHGSGWSGGGGHHTSPVSTGLDSFPSTDAPSVTGGGGLSGPGYSGHSGGSGTPGGSTGSGGYTGGLPGMPGGLGPSGRVSGGSGPRSVPSPGAGARSVPGAPGGASGGRTGSGPGAGRPGMPGMAGGGGMGTAGKGAAAGRGPGGLRTPGGTVGTPSGGAAQAPAQGGSGLHRSRGGSAGTRSATGRMPGAPGMNGAGAQRRPGRAGRDDRRRDFLIEEEETWLPRRNTVPRVIE
ncbi:WXG100 family type VII secretion target [Streptomyces lydicamycinicus]|uniref:WXG100 family type VII secretion target n=2 Tax=Streptomyces lydicamycinicus TaxID=1546107 RepID=UPI003C2CEEB4